MHISLSIQFKPICLFNAHETAYRGLNKTSKGNGKCGHYESECWHCEIPTNCFRKPRKSQKRSCSMKVGKRSLLQWLSWLRLSALVLASIGVARRRIPDQQHLLLEIWCRICFVWRRQQYPPPYKPQSVSRRWRHGSITDLVWQQSIHDHSGDNRMRKRVEQRN